MISGAKLSVHTATVEWLRIRINKDEGKLAIIVKLNFMLIFM